jgi:hypothetical protein
MAVKLLNTVLLPPLPAAAGLTIPPVPPVPTIILYITPTSRDKVEYNKPPAPAPAPRIAPPPPPPATIKYVIGILAAVVLDVEYTHPKPPDALEVIKGICYYANLVWAPNTV